MLTRDPKEQKDQVQIFSIDQVVPKNHILRDIDRAIDFSFIYDLVKDKYCLDNGRPSIDPVLLIKIPFIQYLFGIRSMRQTMREIEVNVAYRWFLGLDFYDEIPHFTTFGKNYTRRFQGTDLFEKIFEHILEQCFEKGYVNPELQFIDSTHVKANANRHKLQKVKVQRATRTYQKELIKEINKDREDHDKKDLKPPKDGGEKIVEKTVSTTDPESGLFHKGEHKDVFAYSVQTSCDKNGWILGFEVYPGNENDSVTFSNFFKKIEPLEPKTLVMDAGYKTPYIAKTLLDKGILPILPYTRPKGVRGQIKRSEYTYDPHNDSYTCPEDQTLEYRTTNREGHREYKSNPKICKNCSRLEECTKSKNFTKILTRHIWQNYIEACEAIRYTQDGKALYKLRKETIERIFGTAKESHGFRYTTMIGAEKMRYKAALTYACLNLKKLSKMMRKDGKLGGEPSKNRGFIFNRVQNILLRSINEQTLYQAYA